MRVLMVHNYVKPPSGENTVFDQELQLLQSHGIEVIAYTRHNQEIDKFSFVEKLKLPWEIVWSHRTVLDLERLIDLHRPAVAHFHNIFPLISPAAYYACRRRGVPVVQTIHNFRLICLNAYAFRDGAICLDCRKSLFRGISWACYRNSKVQSAGVAVMLWLHRLLGTWKKMVTRYICMTPFLKDLFIQFGLPKEKICIKPHFIFESQFSNRNGNDDYAVFIGRIGPEKGIETLIKAWEGIQGIKLYIIGKGPLESSLKKHVQNNKIKYLGFIEHQYCLEILQKSRFLLLPSDLYETFGMVILEAMSVGKPVIASRLGSLPDLISNGKNGLLFEPGNPKDLADKVRWLLEHEAEAEEMGRRAREEYEKKYTPEKNFELIMKIYEEAITSAKNESTC